MKKIFILIAVAILAFSTVSCSEKETEAPTPLETVPSAPAATATAKPKATASARPTQIPVSPTPYDGPVNPLTGLPVSEDISALRPLAIMLNNIKDALPQHGVSKADIIYETLAEGGITRMLAVFQDVRGADKIGSVRSARAYYIDLAQGHDAIFVHAGGSPQAYDIIYGRGISTIDGVTGYAELFYRDEYRMYNAGYEHSLFTTAELLYEHLPEYGWIRREHDEDYTCNMKFTDDETPKYGETADTLRVFFSDYKTGIFEYDREKGLYMVSQYGSEYTDGNTEEQVGVTNVLVLYTYISNVYGDTEGRIDVELEGSGAGYFASGGHCVPINWSKDSNTSPFVYTLSDGEEIKFGKGATYINIIPNGNSFEYE